MVKITTSLSEYWYKKIKELNIPINFLIILGYKTFLGIKEENKKLLELEGKIREIRRDLDLLIKKLYGKI